VFHKFLFDQFRFGKYHQARSVPVKAVHRGRAALLPFLAEVFADNPVGRFIALPARGNRKKARRLAYDKQIMILMVKENAAGKPAGAVHFSIMGITPVYRNGGISRSQN
jgi:hypothetical protein